MADTLCIPEKQYTSAFIQGVKDYIRNIPQVNPPKHICAAFHMRLDWDAGWRMANDAKQDGLVIKITSR